MTTTVVRTRADADAERLPGAFGIGLQRGALELRQFFRQRDQVVFTFAFPVVFLFLFASIFSDDVAGAGSPRRPRVPLSPVGTPARPRSRSRRSPSARRTPCP